MHDCACALLLLLPQGPFNGYSRQPHLTTYRDGHTPSFIPRDHEVYSNVWLSSYHSEWTFDHDDGSSFFRDHHNLCLFGGFKSGTFGASGKVFAENFVLFPEHVSDLDGIYPNTNGPSGIRAGACVKVLSNPGENWTGNTCVTTGAGTASCARLVGGQNQYYCSHPSDCNVSACQQTGHEVGSVSHPLPSEPEIQAMVESFVAHMPA